MKKIASVFFFFLPFLFCFFVEGTPNIRDIREWATKIDKNFIFPDGFQPPPPLSVSNDEWQNRMPRPLKEDLNRWLRADITWFRDTLECPCRKKVDNNTYIGPKSSFFFKDGIMWFSGTIEKEEKTIYDYHILNHVARYLNEKYGDLPPVRLFMDHTSVHRDVPCLCDLHFPPILVLASKQTDKGVLRRPTPYLNPDWAKNTVQSHRKNKNTWENRTDTACWRGRISSWPGSKDRIEVLLLLEKWKKEKPDFAKHFDIGNTDPFVADVEGWYKMKKITGPQRDAFLTIPQINQVSQEWFSTCKYSLHLSGHSQGGYSRALQSLLALKTTVLFWENPYREFYYDWLTEGKEYISVNFSNIEQVTYSLLRNDKKAKEIATNGALFYENYLQWENILVYWEWIILSMMRYQKISNPEITSNECSCVPAKPLRLCNFCTSTPLTPPPPTTTPFAKNRYNLFNN